MKRKNKKTGKTEYRTSFRWKDDKGITHQSNTPWCETKLEADNLAKRTAKRKAESYGTLPRGDKLVSSVFEEYIKSLRDQIDDDTLRNKTGVITEWQRANTIKRNYFLEEVKVKDVDSTYFRRWMEYINKTKLSGNTIRSCKTILNKFNRYLADNGYYASYNRDSEVSYALGQVHLKPKRSGSREKERVIPTIEHIENIRRVYDENLGKFKNFYYYTLFYTLFYTGMRVSELVGLQWKNIDLSPEERIIYIKNGISSKEKVSTALKRTELEIYSTKNEPSYRGIVIFDVIYDLLVDYKYAYQLHYQMEDIEECFVFPRLTDPHKYQKHNNILEELNKVCEKAEIKKLDLGMFRHGCALFLIMPPPEGLGYTRTEVLGQLGHCDEKMLRTVYARLEHQQMTRQLKSTFNKVYHPAENKKAEEQLEEIKYIVKRVEGNNEAASVVSRMLRFAQEIQSLPPNGTYFYQSKDKAIIDLLKTDYPDIIFKEKNFQLRR